LALLFKTKLTSSASMAAQPKRKTGLSKSDLSFLTFVKALK